MDRIDLYVPMNEEQTQEATQTSNELFEHVLKAFMMQKKRGQIELNGKMDEQNTEHFCILEEKAEQSLMMAQNHLGLSGRSVHKIKRIARTIADLAESKTITQEHLLEALSFRKR